MSTKKIIKRLLRNPGIDALLIFLVLIGAVYAYSGVWPQPLAVVESTSMMHADNDPLYIGTLEPGDIVVLKSISGPKDIITWEEGRKTGYKTFGNYGDVIVYRRYNSSVLIVHRALRWVNKGDLIIDSSGIWRAPYSGFITKGDNNPFTDQESSISYHMPIKPEWIIAKVGLEIPYLGILKLYFIGSKYVTKIPTSCKIMAGLLYGVIFLSPLIIEGVIKIYRKVLMWIERRRYLMG